jgi:hypothetical protein
MVDRFSRHCNRGWFTELLLLFGSLSGKVAASSPGFVASKRVSEIGRVPGS